MVERSELITVTRQIGGMMEAGVDILRITRVLRAQTENPRLLQAYNALDHDLTMGQSLAEAMARAPDVWSPFAVSLVQQGEARNDLAGAFYKVAEFLQKDEEQEAAQQREHHEIHEVIVEREILSAVPIHVGQSNSPMTVIALDGLIDRLQTLGLRSLTWIAGLLLTLATVWWAFGQKLIDARWINVTLCSVAALFMGSAGILVQRRIEADRRRESRCSFCGQYHPSGIGLERAPRFDGAAICARCAAIITLRHKDELTGDAVLGGVPDIISENLESAAPPEKPSGASPQTKGAPPVADQVVNGANGAKSTPENKAKTAGVAAAAGEEDYD